MDPDFYRRLRYHMRTPPSRFHNSLPCISRLALLSCQSLQICLYHNLYRHYIRNNTHDVPLRKALEPMAVIVQNCYSIAASRVFSCSVSWDEDILHNVEEAEEAPNRRKFEGRGKGRSCQN